MNVQKIKRVSISLKSGETQVINGNFVDTITLEYEPNSNSKIKKSDQLVSDNMCLVIKNKDVS